MDLSCGGEHVRTESAGPGNQQRLQAATCREERGGRSISLYPCGGRPVQLQVDARVRSEIDRGGRRTDARTRPACKDPIPIIGSGWR